MRYCDYERALSVARLNKYLVACDGDRTKALVLYRYNVKLCQKFYGLLNMFEIVLRNAINNHYILHYNDNDWIKNQLDEGLLETHPHNQVVHNMILSLTESNRYSNDRIVSSVSLGFWTYMFNKKPFLKGGQTLLKVFPNKAFGLGQKTIYNELQLIKNFRNKIAHHEAICFDSSGARGVIHLKEYYYLILKYIHFLGYSENHLFYGMDILPYSIIDNIEKL